MRYWLGGAFVVAWIACSIGIMRTNHKIWEEVNGSLPSSERFPEFSKGTDIRKILSRHRTLFPQSALRQKLGFFFWMSLAAVIFAASFLIRL